MKSKLFLYRILTIFLLVGITGTLMAKIPAINMRADLTPEEKEGLQKMREEEKLAHDIYMKLYDKWQINAFYNIAQSEQRHTDALASLLNQFQLDDPFQKETGVFKDIELQKTYDELLKKGMTSREDALKVGATIEDLDIADLDELMKATKNEDILAVYENLNRGSRNHMRTFSSLLGSEGISYSPVFISSDRYTTIIESRQERGSQVKLATCQDKQGGNKLGKKNNRRIKGTGSSCNSGKKRSCQKESYRGKGRKNRNKGSI